MATWWRWRWRWRWRLRCSVANPPRLGAATGTTDAKKVYRRGEVVLAPQGCVGARLPLGEGGPALDRGGGGHRPEGVGRRPGEGQAPVDPIAGVRGLPHVGGRGVRPTGHAGRLPGAGRLLAGGRCRRDGGGTGAPRPAAGGPAPGATRLIAAGAGVGAGVAGGECAGSSYLCV